MRDKLRRDFLTATLVWIVAILVFFQALSSNSTGNIQNWLALGTFVVGSIAFLYGLNKLALIVNNMRKLGFWSFLIWLITLIIFAVMIWDSNKVIEHRLFTTGFWGVVGVGDIILGIAAFLSFISSFGSLPKKIDMHHQRETKSYAKTSLTSKISDELDDIIFIPKKKKGLGIGVVMVGALTLGILTISFFSSDEPTSTQAPSSSITATTSNLTISETKIAGNGQQSFTGTIHNNSANLATDVVVRVDFAKDKEMKQTFDTRYFPIDYVAANGAFTFNIPFDLNYRGEYWWNARIEDAVFK